MPAIEMGTADITSLRDARVRGHVYGILSRSFAYPDQELVTVVLKSGALVELLWGLSQVLETPHLSLSEMGDWAIQHTDTVLLEELSIDYTRLFVTGMPRVIAPPYESVYLNQGLLMGEVVSGVLSAYREAGLAIQDSYDDLPDHLSAELEFMQFLSQAEKDAQGIGDAVTSELWRHRQIHFLSEHLGRWAPECLEKISSGASTPFYRLIADVTLQFLRWDTARLAAAVRSTATEDNQ